MSRGEKVVFIGDSGVGKTSIIATAAGNADENPNPTVAAASVSICKQTDRGDVVSLSIWDTAGQEAYQAIIPSYARGAVAAVIVYAVDSPDSFQSLEAWKNLLAETASIEHLFVVGNKTDLERVIAYKDADEFCRKYHMRYFECSAATGQGVEELISAIANAVDPQSKTRQAVVTVDPKGDQSAEHHAGKKGCCH